MVIFHSYVSLPEGICFGTSYGHVRAHVTCLCLEPRQIWTLGANLPRTMRIKACACSLSFAENEVLPTPF